MHRRLSWILLPSQVKLHLRSCMLSGVTSHSVIGSMCQSFQPTDSITVHGIAGRLVGVHALLQLLFLHEFVHVHGLAHTLLSGMRDSLVVLL